MLAVASPTRARPARSGGREHEPDRTAHSRGRIRRGGERRRLQQRGPHRHIGHLDPASRPTRDAQPARSPRRRSAVTPRRRHDCQTATR
jgi:hypothetical protein